MLIRELCVQYRLRPVDTDPPLPDRLTEPKDAAQLLCRLLGAEAIEVCGVLCLSTSHHLLAYHELTRGTIDATIVQSRDVLRTALLAHAAAIIIGHNHPSGEVRPSADDVVVTQRLSAATQLMGIELMDHIIVSAEGRYYSFKESGLL